MVKLLDAIADLVMRVPSEKIQVIAARIKHTNPTKANGALQDVVSTPLAAAAVKRLSKAWQNSKVGAAELAAMLIAASHVHCRANEAVTTELVLTGPGIPCVATRRTEQALLQVIGSAKKALFITSFVAYDVGSIVAALNEASHRGVRISMLLESSQQHGGSITIDAIGKMRTLVPTAQLYAWLDKPEPFADGRVHAKVAVADAHICFVTSANLTGYAMERNMEAGLLIRGGQIPKLLSDHLHALIDMRVISRIES